MEKSRDIKIEGQEATIVQLHRREMRLRSILRSALTSPENRKDARLKLEELLLKIQEAEDELSRLEAGRFPA